jgi:hypothetical protein
MVMVSKSSHACPSSLVAYYAGGGGRERVQFLDDEWSRLLIPLIRKSSCEQRRKEAGGQGKVEE